MLLNNWRKIRCTTFSLWDKIWCNDSCIELTNTKFKEVMIIQKISLFLNTYIHIISKIMLNTLYYYNLYNSTIPILHLLLWNMLKYSKCWAIEHVHKKLGFMSHSLMYYFVGDWWTSRGPCQKRKDKLFFLKKMRTIGKCLQSVFGKGKLV